MAELATNNLVPLGLTANQLVPRLLAFTSDTFLPVPVSHWLMVLSPEAPENSVFEDAPKVSDVIALECPFNLFTTRPTAKSQITTCPLSVPNAKTPELVSSLLLLRLRLDADPVLLLLLFLLLLLLLWDFLADHANAVYVMAK